MTRITRRFLDTPDGQLHCREAGQGAPVVLLPTMPFGTLPLVPLMQALAPSCRAITIDLMGYAPSDDRRRPWQVGDYAANLIAAFDTLGLDRLRLLGGHLTGLVAVEIAVRQPQRISHLALDGLYAWTEAEKEPYRSSSTPPLPFADSGDPMKVRWESFVGILRRFDPQFEVTADNATHVARLALAFFSIGLGGPPYPATFEYDLLTALPRLRMPTLLFQSPTDSLRHFHGRAMGLIADVREHSFVDINPLQQVRQPGRAGEYAAVLAKFLELVD